MTKGLVSVAAVLSMVVLAAGSVAADDKPATIVRWSQMDLKWEPIPDMPVMVAKAWSHPSGSYCQFNKFPKGTKTLLHHHTADVTSVVLEGRFGSGEAGPVKLVGPGTYQMIPGGLKHVTECGADADCVVFTCGSAPFDLVPASAPAK